MSDIILTPEKYREQNMPKLVPTVKIRWRPRPDEGVEPTDWRTPEPFLISPGLIDIFSYLPIDSYEIEVWTPPRASWVPFGESPLRNWLVQVWKEKKRRKSVR